MYVGGKREAPASGSDCLVHTAPFPQQKKPPPHFLLFFHLLRRLGKKGWGGVPKHAYIVHANSMEGGRRDVDVFSGRLSDFPRGSFGSGDDFSRENQLRPRKLFDLYISVAAV